MPQVLEVLNPQPGQCMLDGTLGRGGHAATITELLGNAGTYIGLDVDPENLAFARTRLADWSGTFHAVQSNFARAGQVLQDLDIPEGVDLLLADLGFASNQMDNPERGFSFQADGPLDMRLDPTLPHSAADLIAHLPESELADVIYRYGDERLSRSIARKIVEIRSQTPIVTTLALADLVRGVYARSGRGRGGAKRSGGKPIDPATRTFMALRMAVNDELEALRQLLSSLPGIVKPGGVAAVISFHSHEDRMVKQAFAEWHQQGSVERITRKPMVADERECFDNPRSRSAKLRAVRFK